MSRYYEDAARLAVGKAETGTYVADFPDGSSLMCTQEGFDTIVLFGDLMAKYGEALEMVKPFICPVHHQNIPDFEWRICDYWDSPAARNDKPGDGFDRMPWFVLMGWHGADFCYALEALGLPDGGLMVFPEGGGMSRLFFDVLVKP